MFIDTSVILAILLQENEAALFIEKMKHAEKLYFSPIVRFEAIARLARLKSGDGVPIKKAELKKAATLIDKFASEYGLSSIAIDIQEARLSTEAFGNFGKGTGHKAQLNMGDCFSYACAKRARLPLLFKGNDFIHTDVKQA